MIAIFDEDGGGDVDFQEFVSGLSAFSSKGNKEEKLKFAFKVYDIDRDGYISNGELFIVLKMMVGSNLKDQQLQQIVDKTIMEADLDRDGKISFEEFQKMVENTDVSMSMTLGMCALLRIGEVRNANNLQINSKRHMELEGGVTAGDDGKKSLWAHYSTTDPILWQARMSRKHCMAQTTALAARLSASVLSQPLLRIKESSYSDPCSMCGNFEPDLIDRSVARPERGSLC